MDRTQASSTLTRTYGLDAQQANSVLDFTHSSEPKPMYLILSSDMLSKSSMVVLLQEPWNFENQTSNPYSYYAASKSNRRHGWKTNSH